MLGSEPRVIWYGASTHPPFRRIALVMYTFTTPRFACTKALYTLMFVGSASKPRFSVPSNIMYVAPRFAHCVRVFICCSLRRGVFFTVGASYTMVPCFVCTNISSPTLPLICVATPFTFAIIVTFFKMLNNDFSDSRRPTSYIRHLPSSISIIVPPRNDFPHVA